MKVLKLREFKCFYWIKLYVSSQTSHLISSQFTECLYTFVDLNLEKKEPKMKGPGRNISRRPSSHSLASCINNGQVQWGITIGFYHNIYLRMVIESMEYFCESDCLNLHEKRSRKPFWNLFWNFDHALLCMYFNWTFPSESAVYFQPLLTPEHWTSLSPHQRVEITIIKIIPILLIYIRKEIIFLILWVMLKLWLEIVDKAKYFC